MHIFLHVFSKIFKWSWCTINFVREFIFNVLLFIFIFICIGFYFQIKNNNHPIEMKQGALKLNLIGYITERTNSNHDFKNISQYFMTVGNKVKETALFDLVYAIRQAKDDKHITGIVLELDNFFGGDQPALEYIGKALQEFRNTGKPIYSIGKSYTQAQYYLASFANFIYLNPLGMVDLHGFSNYRLYYKTFLDKFKITAHIFRVGMYKSAVEPLIRDDMSHHTRNIEQRLVNMLWSNYLNTIANNRNVPIKKLFPHSKEILENLKKLNGDYALYAKQHALVDYIASDNLIQRQLSKVFGCNEENREYNSISIYDYPLENEKKTNVNNIAVIIAEGTIVDGEDELGFIGANTTARKIRSARLDKNIKAIVLRINSPGGSVHASEIIREELSAVREQGKPIVVSMGGTTASGGYWIATPADYIIASPSTITGSIGIFSAFNTFEKFFNQLGIHTDGVSISELSDFFYAKKLSKDTEKLIQLTIENGYKKFITLVANARKQPLEKIEEVAQGLIWIGNEAVEKNLVNALGDFDDAVHKAAELAKLKDYDLCWLEEETSIFEEILDQINKIIKVSLYSNTKNINELHSKIYQEINKNLIPLSLMQDPLKQYAFCINCSFH